ncbi:MAG TPA: diphosphate--fructose-6-phosphate 1-phosphotransferase [Bryobacteraceae bacterium]|nr:diphosphate--fructose-6-phosphate 1-phosphotransferase [Bryobacteraceae bacterium]
MTDRKLAVIAHGGGPTAVINASLAGVVEECRARGIHELSGAAYGVNGILSEDFIDLLARDRAEWDRIARAPGSIIGSSRRKLEAADFERIVLILKKRCVAFLFLNGGNGTMEAAARMAEAAESVHPDLRVIGIPKTIDNDLACTDHSPGYASAARFFAYAIRDIGADNRALRGITVVEILGRNAGWIAAATVLARKRDDDAPHLVYLPERRLPLARLLEDVEQAHREFGHLVIAVCEGQLDENREPFGADARVSSRAPLALNLAHVLSKKISSSLGLPARSEKPGLLGRSCSVLVSEVDREEARLCGRAAVRAALAGETAKMVALERATIGPYCCKTGLVPLRDVAGSERLFPESWLPTNARDDLPGFRAWAAPLVGEVEALPHLR